MGVIHQVLALTGNAAVTENLKYLTQALQIASIVALAIPLTIGLRRHRKLTVATRRLLLYIMVSAAFELMDVTIYFLTHPFAWIAPLQQAVHRIVGPPALFQFTSVMQQVFTMAEYALLVGCFISWPLRYTVRSVARYSIPVFLLSGVTLTIYSLVAPGHNMAPDLILFIAESAVLVLLALLLLVEVNLQSIGTIFQRAEFWGSSGVLIYFAGNLLSLIFILGKQKPDDTVAMVAIMHSLLNITSILLYARALQCRIPSPST